MKAATMTLMSLCVIAGGGMGALARFWLTVGVNTLAPSALPLGTLSVNIVGSFLIGLLAILLFVYAPYGELWRGTLITGFLGGFTTFSAFSLETVKLLQSGSSARAFFYVILSVGCCILATVLGMYIAYTITGAAKQ
jgi:fluoride exporter